MRFITLISAAFCRPTVLSRARAGAGVQVLEGRYRYGAANERREPIPPVQFDSPEVATAGKTTREVLRGWLVFKLFTYDYLVENSVKVYRSR